MSLIAFYLLAFFQLSISLEPREITILILSQKDTYNNKNAQNLKNDILLQSNRINVPKVYLSHEIFTNVGSWAITPILANNYQRILTSDTKWLVLCEDDSVVNFDILVKSLHKENHTSEKYLGYPLKDKEATIIHHFAFFDNPSWFQYPLFRSGLALSIPLLKRLSQRLKNEKFSTDFFIDASHELSLFAWNNGKGHKLTVAPYFCLKPKTGCAIYGKPHSTCANIISNEQILFAVKTCSKFHKERIPIVQKTWAKYATHIRFYSDKNDKSIPTINTKIKNTETGHCSKLLQIFNLVLQEISSNISLSSVKWIVLVDDDTIMSIADLQQLIGCYNFTEDIYLGERYGYRLLSQDGFNYITGGGGIVFTISAIRKLITDCSCPTDSSPDDMVIAVCLLRLGIEAIHSPRFHQARPIDYPPEVLSHPLSFHKFWQIDPFEVYEKWFGLSNKLVLNIGHDNESESISKRQFCPNKNVNELLKTTNSIKHIDL